MYTVGVRKRFPFRFHSMVVLWCEHTLNYDVKSLLCSRKAYHSYGFEHSEFFERPQWVHPTSYTALPGLCFRPWISLPADLWCPQLLQNWRYSCSTIDHRRNPAHQAKALGTSISLERSCWFFNTVAVKKKLPFRFCTMIMLWLTVSTKTE